MDKDKDEEGGPLMHQLLAEFRGLRAEMESLREDLRAVRGDASAGASASQAVPPPHEQLVSLDQIAAIARRRKRGLERYKKGMPGPCDRGGHGRAAVWRWADVRPWLERTFGRTFPENYPSYAVEED